MYKKEKLSGFKWIFCSFVFFTLYIRKNCEVLSSYSGTAQNSSLPGCYVSVD